MNFLKQGFASKMHTSPKGSQQLPPGRGSGLATALVLAAMLPTGTLHARGRCPQCAKGAVLGPGNCKPKPCHCHCHSHSQGEARLVSVHYQPLPHGPRKPGPPSPHRPPARRHLKCPVPQPCHQARLAAGGQHRCAPGKGLTGTLPSSHSPRCTHRCVAIVARCFRTKVHYVCISPSCLVSDGCSCFLRRTTRTYTLNKGTHLLKKQRRGKKRSLSPSPLTPVIGSHAASASLQLPRRGFRKLPWISTRSP